MNHSSRINQLALVCITSLLTFMLLGNTLCWAGSISGRVTDVIHGYLQQDIYVSLVQNNSTVMYVKTDINGNYSIIGIPDGSYKLVFSDPQWLEYITQWYNNSPNESGAATITVTAASNHTGINAALVPGGFITGTVTDIQTTEPVMGATVSIYNGTTGTLVEEVVAYGTYNSSVLPPGSYTLRFSKSDTLTTWYNQVSDQQSSTKVTVTALNRTAGINATLTFFGRIAGKVTNTSGVGIANIATQVYDSGGNVIDYGYPDSTGNYITPRLPNGSYKICFEGYGNYEARCYNDALNISAATPITVTAPLTAIANAQLRRYVTISGTVRKTDGAPFAAKVELYDSMQRLVADTMSSAQDGTYSLGSNGNYLVEGNYKVRFRDLNVGYAEQWYPAKADFASAATIPAFLATTGIDAAMKAVGRISGQTVNSKSYGIPNIAVTVFDASQNAVASLTSDAGGFYQTDYLPEGSYRIRFDGTASGYPLEWYSDQPDFARATPVTVVINGVSGINATLVSPLKISGKVANSRGDGIFNALIYIYNSRNAYVTSFYSDVSGAFDSGELPADSYRIKIMAQGYPEQWHGGNDFASATPVTMSLSSGPAVANIALKEDGGRIYGRVTDSSGAGIAGAYAQFYDAASGALVGYINSDATGNYVSGKLNDGSYRIMFQSPFTGHLQEWYDNRGDIATATAVAVTTANPAVGIDAMLLKNLTLSVTLAGTGDGAVNSDPAGIACTSGTCTAGYPENSTVKLSATPGRTSQFGGWAAACTNPSGDCTVTMAADRTATATFTPAPMAKIGLTGYDSLAAAYAAAGSGDTILLLDTEMPDAGFTLDRGKSITLKGGYRNDYSGKSGLPSILRGVLTISTGSLTVESLVVW